MKFLLSCLSAALLTTAASAAPSSDLVTTALPGFPSHLDKFSVYSGFLNVSTPTLESETGYTSLMIHYQFDTSMSATASSDPVSVWHTGGPGGSSMYGLYGELGYFQVSSSGLLANDDYSFNKVSNMLYLESPAGSFLTPTTAGMSSGFSYCLIEGERQETCTWNDTSQAAAYAATLAAFYDAFPEYGSNDLLFIGESYAGQYIPNVSETRQKVKGVWFVGDLVVAANPSFALAQIANYILTSPNADPSLAKRLKGIAVGNGCWGGGESYESDSFMCNGPNEDRDNVELFHGKGLMSTKLYKKIQAACSFSETEVDFDSATPAPEGSAECEALLDLMEEQVGPINIYNVYDNCPSDDDAGQAQKLWSERSGKGVRWVRK